MIGKPPSQKKSNPEGYGYSGVKAGFIVLSSLIAPFLAMTIYLWTSRSLVDIKDTTVDFVGLIASLGIGIGLLQLARFSASAKIVYLVFAMPIVAVLLIIYMYLYVAIESGGSF